MTRISINMGRNILLFIVSIFNLASSLQLQNCVAINANYSLFDLCLFTQSKPFNLSNSDLTNSLSFSLGNNHVTDCSDQEDIWGIYQTGGSCYDIAVQSPSYSLINESNPDQGLIMTFPTNPMNASNNTTKMGKTYQLIVNLECDMSDTDIDQTPFTWSQESGKNNTKVITVNGSSRYACPIVSLNAVINFFNQNKAIFAACFGFLGLILLLFGLKLLKFALFIIPTILIALVLGCLLFEVVTIGTEVWVIYLILGVSLAVGIIVGVLALYYKRFAFFLIGGAVGVVTGFLVYNAILSPIIKDTYGVLPLYLTLGLCGLIGGGIGLWLYEPILIIATCLVGSFIIVRAAAVFIGGFPAESEVADGLKQFNAVTYAYLAAIIIIAGIGMYFQFKLKKKRDSKKKEEEEEEEKTSADDGKDFYTRL